MVDWRKSETEDVVPGKVALGADDNCLFYIGPDRCGAKTDACIKMCERCGELYYACCLSCPVCEFRARYGRQSRHIWGWRRRSA